jgi:two-component system chemotaxis sensor kinase CheA
MAQDRYRYFRVEARELAEQLTQGILELEKGALCGDVVPRLLRLAHTLKGAARVVRQSEIAEGANRLEDAMAPLREAMSPVPPGAVDGFLATVDEIADRTKALGSPAVAPDPDPVAAVAEESFRFVHTDVSEMDTLLKGIAEIQVQLTVLRRDIHPLGRVRQIADLLAGQLAAAHVTEALPSAGAAAPGRTRWLAEELRNLVARIERGLSDGS